MLKDTQQQKQYKILLIGDACIDEYVYGECNRLSPEAPVPILTQITKEHKHGMSANVYQNFKNILVGEINYLCNDKQQIKKIRFIDKKTNYQIMRHDIEGHIVPLQTSSLPNESYDAIVISDYDKGYITKELIRYIVSHYNTQVFVDTKKHDMSIFENCIVKINEKEFNNCINLSGDTDLVVTLGSRGALYRDKIYSTDTVDVHDVCGAGDVFLSTMVCRWLETGDLIDSVKCANKCASLSVTKSGTYQLSRKEYEERY
tara:strand:- start:23942 stop:24718 length:777 start_codon:yes stop_codon:yes gene_type:complete